MRLFNLAISIQKTSFVLLSLFMGICSTEAFAQQAKKPFTVGLGLGNGMIGQPHQNTALQPEMELSYIPGRWGVEFATGFSAYQSTSGPAQYRQGFEEFTSVTSAKDKWQSFFLGIGPRLEFGDNLPVQLKAGLDLSLTYNAPPEYTVAFEDPEGNFAGVDLTLSDYTPGDDFKKWSPALQPEFQVLYSPGRSQRFGFHLTTGVRQQLAARSFTYRERDLSEVMNVDNVREMFDQFEMAPVVERTSHLPKTNFFVNAGISISFGGSKISTANRAQDYNAARSNKPTSIAADDVGGGNNDADADSIETAQDYNSSRSNKPRTETRDDILDCDDEDDCQGPGTVNRAQDYNSSRSNKPTSIAADGVGGGNNDTDADSIETAQDYNSSRSNKPRTETRDDILDCDDEDDCQGPDTVNRGQDYNAARSNKPTSIAADGVGGGNNDADADSIETAQDYNSSRSNKPRTETRDDILDCDDEDDCQGPGSVNKAQDYNSSRSNKPTSIAAEDIFDIDSDGDGVEDSIETAQDYNSSRSNKPRTETPDEDRGGDAGPTRLTSPKNLNRMNQPKESFAMQAMVLNPGAVIAIGPAFNEFKAVETGNNPLYNGESNSGANPLFEGEMNPKDDDVDTDRYPEFLVRSSFSISKRSARTGRSRTDENGNEGDVEQVHLKVEINDPDSDDDGLMDLADNATFSISQTSESVERSRADDSGRNWESRSAIEPQRIIRSTGGNNTEVLAWTYNLSSSNSVDPSVDNYSDLMNGARMVVSQYTDENSSIVSWHFDLQVKDFNDPDSDNDGITDTVQNASFSISKRSARTGRN